MATPAIGYALDGAFDSMFTHQHAYAHANRDARAAAVASAWDTGSNRQITITPPSAAYAAAAAKRRAAKAAHVVPQTAATTTPFTPATSRVLRQANTGRLPRPALAPSLDAASFPGAPRVQHPLAAAFGPGSQMYATGMPNNGMPSFSTPAEHAVHIDGEFAGTFMDPITGITYASYMTPDQLPPVQADTAVLRLGEPSRMLEFMTGVSHVPKPVRTDVFDDDWATVADGIQLPDFMTRTAIRSREAQDAAAQVFFTRDNQETPENDTFWDGYIGDTYVLRTWTDTQTMSDNAEFNLANMEQAQPDCSDTYAFANVGAHAGGLHAATFTFAPPKPSQPGHTTIALEDAGPSAWLSAPASEKTGRAQLCAARPTPFTLDAMDALPTRHVQTYDARAKTHAVPVHTHVRIDTSDVWSPAAAAQLAPLTVDSVRDTRFTAGHGTKIDTSTVWDATPSLGIMARESARRAGPSFVPPALHAHTDEQVHLPSTQIHAASASEPVNHMLEQSVRAHIVLDTAASADWGMGVQAQPAQPATTTKWRTSEIGHGRSTVRLEDDMYEASAHTTGLPSERVGRSQPAAARTTTVLDDATVGGDNVQAVRDGGSANCNVDRRVRAERYDILDGRVQPTATVELSTLRPDAVPLDSFSRRQEQQAHAPRVDVSALYDGGHAIGAATSIHADTNRRVRDAVMSASGRNMDSAIAFDQPATAMRVPLDDNHRVHDTVMSASGRNMDGTAGLEQHDTRPTIAWDTARRLRAGEQHGTTARPAALEFDMIPTNRSLTQFRDVQSVRDTTAHAGGQHAMMDAVYYARQAYHHPETHGTGAFTRQTAAVNIAARPAMFETDLVAQYTANDPGQRHVEAAAAAAEAAAKAAAANRAPIMDTVAVAYESAYDYETE